MLAARAGLVPGSPLMHPAFYIRPARVEEAAALSDLCFRSKAVWGYDPEFMALILAALGIAGEDIAAGDVWVATGADGQIAGVVALAPGNAPGGTKLRRPPGTLFRQNVSNRFKFPKASSQRTPRWRRQSRANPSLKPNSLLAAY
jgi:hypothetical protein